MIFTLLDDGTPSVKGTSCYVLESLTENMDSDAILPYLSALMNKLVTLVSTSKPRVQLMAISAIGSTAVGAEAAFAPYFTTTASLMEQFLVITDPKFFALRGRALECMGYMAIAVEAEVFAPVFEASMKYALESLTLDDMELSDFVFAFFCNISKVFREEFALYLPSVLPPLIAAILMDDGMQVKGGKNASQESSALANFDDADPEGEEEDEDEEGGNTIISVRTSMLDMKAGAVQALGSLAEHTGAAFDPYVNTVVPHLLMMAGYFHDSVRAGALQALVHCVVVSAQVHPGTAAEGQWVKNAPRATDVSPVTTLYLTQVMDMLVEALMDEEETVVEVACESCVTLAQTFGPSALAPQMEAILAVCGDLLSQDHVCQLKCENDDEEDVVKIKSGEPDDDDAGEPVLLLEGVMELIATCCRCFGAAMHPFITSSRPTLEGYLQGLCSANDRAVIYGGLAEVCLELEPAFVLSDMALPLTSAVIRGCTDAIPNVRQNAAFCLGIFCQVSGASFASHYPSILAALAPLFEDSKAGVSDNACAALCRMMMAHPAGVPIAQVLPTLLSKLPFTEDLSEIDTVYKCLLQLLSTQVPEVRTHLPQVVATFVAALVGQVELDEDVEDRVVQALKWLLETEGATIQPLLMAAVSTAEEKDMLSERLSS